MRKTGRNLVTALAGLVILTLIGPLGCRQTPSASPELQSLLAADTLDRQVGDAGIRAAVRAFYTETGATLAWSRDARSKQTDQALGVLATARAHGLDPEAYQLGTLTGERDVLARQPKPEQRLSLAIFDVRLTSALIRLGRDVAVGRISPRSVDSRWKSQRAMPNLASTLAAARDDVSQWLPAIQPRHPEYAALMKGLAALQGAETKGGWPAVRGVAVAPGASHPAVAALRARLQASGDLGAASVRATDTISRWNAPCGSFRNTRAWRRQGGSIRRRWRH